VFLGLHVAAEIPSPRLHHDFSAAADGVEALVHPPQSPPIVKAASCPTPLHNSNVHAAIAHRHDFLI